MVDYMRNNDSISPDYTSGQIAYYDTNKDW
jgi:hypothetical protein